MERRKNVPYARKLTRYRLNALTNTIKNAKKKRKKSQWNAAIDRQNRLKTD